MAEAMAYNHVAALRLGSRGTPWAPNEMHCPLKWAVKCSCKLQKEKLTLKILMQIAGEKKDAKNRPASCRGKTWHDNILLQLAGRKIGVKKAHASCRRKNWR